MTGLQTQRIGAMQAGAIPMGITAQQLDINSILSMMLPIIIIVMMMKMMMGAFGEEKPKLAPVVKE